MSENKRYHIDLNIETEFTKSGNKICFNKWKHFQSKWHRKLKLVEIVEQPGIEEFINKTQPEVDLDNKTDRE